MEKIYIGFSTHKGNLLSKLIQLVNGTPYSHVYIRRVSKYGEYVYQASGLAVNFMNIETFREIGNITVEEYEFDLPDDKRDDVLSFFIKYAGRPYGLKDLFQILAMTGARRIGWKLTFKGDGDKSFICSELGDLFCEKIIGIPTPDGEDFISPKELNPYVAQAGKRVA